MNFGWLNPFKRLVENDAIPWARVQRSSYYRALSDGFKVVTGPINFESNYDSPNEDGTIYNPAGIFDYATGFIFYACLRLYHYSTDAVEKTDNYTWYVPAFFSFVLAGAGWLGRIAFGIACLPLIALFAVPVRAAINGSSQALKEPAMSVEGTDTSTGEYRPSRDYVRVVPLREFLGRSLELDNLQAEYTTKKVTYKTSDGITQVEAVAEPGMLGRATNAVTGYVASWMPNSSQPRHRPYQAQASREARKHEVIDTITLSYTPPPPRSNSFCSPSWGFMSWLFACCPTFTTGYAIYTLPQNGIEYAKKGANLLRRTVDPNVMKLTITVSDEKDSPQHKQLESLFKMNVGFLFTQAKEKNHIKEDKQTHQLQFR